jgi:hypothetical protein
MEQFVHMAQNIVGLGLYAFTLFLQLIIGVLKILIAFVQGIFAAIF